MIWEYFSWYLQEFFSSPQLPFKQHSNTLKWKCTRLLTTCWQKSYFIYIIICLYVSNNDGDRWRPPTTSVYSWIIHELIRVGKTSSLPEWEKCLIGEKNRRKKKRPDWCNYFNEEVKKMHRKDRDTGEQERKTMDKTTIWYYS